MDWVLRRATAKLRVLPDFLIIGAQKAGTSFLYEQLSLHPEILPAFRKEVRYFDFNYDKELVWYRAQFPLRLSIKHMGQGHGEMCITGEASPYYLYHPDVPRRVKSVIPDVKLLVMLRNPVDRAISGYYETKKKGNEPLSLQSALDAEEERIEGESEKLLRDDEFESSPHFRYSYMARGRYVDQLLAWREYFRRDQMFVLQSEKLFADPERCFPEICKFLGVSEWLPSNPERTNAGRYHPAEEKVRQKLFLHFAPHNKKLYEYIGETWDWDNE